MRKLFPIAAILLFSVSAAHAQIETLHIRGSVYMLAGAGGNITVSAGPDGVLMVDTGNAQMSDKVIAAIQQLQKTVSTNGLHEWKFGAETRSNLPRMISPPAPPKPLRYIINTHFDPDHTGGNAKLATTGATFTLADAGMFGNVLFDAGDGAAIIAHENVLKRMGARVRNQPAVSWRALPTNTYYKDRMKLSSFFNGEAVMIMHQPAANTDGDSMVYFRGSDVISAGDIFVTTGYPVIDVARGGGIQGVIDGLNRILDMSIPEFRMEGGTMIVPGHGRLSDSADVAYYRDMVTILRDRIHSMIKQGMTLPQIKAAKPTRDYDPRYGAPDAFVDAVYRSLTRK